MGLIGADLAGFTLESWEDGAGPGPGCQIMTGRLPAEVAWMLPLWGGGSEMRTAFPTRFCARQPAGLVRHGSSPRSHSGQRYL